MIGIYKITSPSNKIYIGQSINIEKRFKQYITFKSNSIGPKLFNSLNKYKPENHVFEIIEECSLEQLNEREIYWKQEIINMLGWKQVLFCELYDRGGGPRNEETKRKMSIKHQEYLTKPEIILKRKTQCKLKATKEIREKAVNNTNWEERNNKLRKVKRNIKNKPINQYNLEGKFIKEWESSSSICKHYETRIQNLNACLRGIYKTYMGYIWKYK